jgi:hypothetical protein
VRQLENNNITIQCQKYNKNTTRKNQTRDREKAEEKSSRVPSKMLHDRPHMHLENNSGTGQRMAKRLNTGFIDFEKAFDTVNRENCGEF